VLHPAGKKVVVGLRFSCPSAAADRGRPLAAQSADIQKLARLVVPDNYQAGSPPPILAAPDGEWPDFLRFVHWLDTSLAAKDVPVALKLLRALHWLAAIEKGRLDQITDAGAEEILAALVNSATNKLPTLPASPARPSRFGRLFIRLMVFEHTRTTRVNDPGEADGRWQRLRAVWRFVRAGGRTPALRNNLAAVKFSDLEKPFPPLSPAMEALLTRYFRLKVQSLHFCGAAFHERPLIEGFRSLALLYPVILWLSRWLALSEGRVELAETDVVRAVSMVDYHHGYSPHLEWRVRLLHHRNDIAKWIGWHGREATG
jgi:lysine-N-methylase